MRTHRAASRKKSCARGRWWNTSVMTIARSDASSNGSRCPLSTTSMPGQTKISDAIASATASPTLDLPVACACAIDPDTGLPHIFRHNVDENEVLDVLRRPIEETRGRRNSIVALGQTRAGRYLKVIYVPEKEGDGIFVIAAF